MTIDGNRDETESHPRGEDPAVENSTQHRKYSGIITDYRVPLASELRSIAATLSGGSRRRLQQLADQVAETTDWQAVLRRPGVLELYHAIDQGLERVNAASGVDSPTRPERSSTIRKIAAEVLTQHEGRFKKLDGVMSRLIYPFVLFALFVVVFVFTCYWVVPELQEFVSREPSLLPPQTELLFATADVVRGIGLPHLFAAFVMIAVVGLWQKRVVFERSSVSPWSVTNHLWMSRRAALGNWAWHIATLTEVGIPTGEAITLAAESAHPSWLRRRSRRWLRQRVAAVNDDALWWPVKLRRRRIDLLGYALFVDQRPRGEGQLDASRSGIQICRSDLLHQVAMNYWERQASWSRFWSVWATPIAYLLVGLWIGWIWFAMFSPIKSFIDLLRW